MTERLAAANAALKAGRTEDAIQHMVAIATDDPAQPAQFYRALLVQFYRAKRYADGETWSVVATERHPRDADLWNTRGVLLRLLRRQPEALTALDQAIKLNPRLAAAQSNRGNVLLDLGDGARAEAVFAKLARQEPRNADYQRQLGRALLKQGRADAATVRFRQAIALKKDHIDAWLDLMGLATEAQRFEEAEELAERALAANPTATQLFEAKSIVLRRSGQLRRAEAFLLDLLPAYPDSAALHYQLGGVISDWDRDRGNVHMRKAVELDPQRLDYMMALIESLERTRTGDEGANIEEAYRYARETLSRIAEFTPANFKVISEVFVRVAAYEDMAKLGDPNDLGRLWAENGRHTALLKQLPRVRSYEDRLELMEHHRIWGRRAEKIAAERPIVHPPARAAGGKIRLGFMSSDLRQHPVGYFALPLFQHLDKDRFEVFVYSFYQGQEDAMQAYMASQSEGFRWWSDITSRDAAQRIAEDQLDMLIELGGSTHMNKLDVMAYKPARLSASWLGYPHSAGLSTIDYLVVDPYLMPEDPALMLEKPLMLPNAWYALGSSQFRDEPAVNPQSPFERNGFVTFGTSNNTYKYSPDVLQAWARAVARTPNSQFMFVRPEGGSISFRENMARHFAAEGVSADRLRFESVRGAHLPFYNEMDISLDPFPQTGGTTTCESLWMGVPVITLVGPSVFERLSYSVLKNLDLDALCTTSVDGYVDAAVALAHDPARLSDLRRNLRPRMKTSPLGQTDAFARDFYDAVARTIAEA